MLLPVNPRGSPADAPGTIGIVEDLRGVASLAVALFHLRLALPEGALKSLLGSGWMGVNAFFVISGFVMPLALARADYRISRFPRFVAKRVMRLDPPYLACIALIVVLDILSSAAPAFQGAPYRWDGARVSSHLLYLTQILGMAWLNPVFWTLALEFQYYLALGLLFPVVGRSPTAGFLLVVAACAAGPFLASGTTTVLPYLPLFAMGFVALRWREGKDPRAVLALCWAVLAGAACRHEDGWPVAVVGVATALLVANVRGGTRYLGWLGAISYSLYLLHVPIGGRVVNLGGRVAEGTASRVLVFLAALAVSIAAAWVFHRLLELPSRRWASRVGYRPAAA
jgi:peptidoglycan/LPS O-acetylase OafA/YrhL